MTARDRRYDLGKGIEERMNRVDFVKLWERLRRDGEMAIRGVDDMGFKYSRPMLTGPEALALADLIEKALALIESDAEADGAAFDDLSALFDKEGDVQPVDCIFATKIPPPRKAL
jgi:hypothetical protein